MVSFRYRSYKIDLQKWTDNEIFITIESISSEKENET